MTVFRGIVLLFIGGLLSTSALAQETIFNVPSADVLDRGKVYGEFDFAYLGETNAGAYTPRIVVGIGHQIEVGLNLNGISTPGPSQATLTPTVKWKFYNQNGWAFVVGDDVFIPVQNRTYNLGNYFYMALTKTFETQTRLTMGTFDFTSHVVAGGNQAGGQFGIEQPVSKRVTLAADWFTGNHSAGHFTPGTAIKMSSKATLYAAYEIGNSGLKQGHHLLLVELGWNFN
jgi:hypothetical protein